MASNITAAINFSRDWLSSSLLNVSFLLAQCKKLQRHSGTGTKTGILKPREKRAREMLKLNKDNAGN